MVMTISEMVMDSFTMDNGLRFFDLGMLHIKIQDLASTSILSIFFSLVGCPPPRPQLKMVMTNTILKVVMDNFTRDCIVLT